MSLALHQPRPSVEVALRPYQHEARAAAAEAWTDPDGDAQPMIVLPTGCGKTIMGLSLVADHVRAGGRVVWLAHRTELLTQPLKALASIWPDLARDAGIVQASRDDCSKRIIFASVPTLTRKRRRDKILAHGPVTLLVVDECHHSVAKSQRAVIEALGAGQRLGLTATPHRDDGKDLGELWQIAYSYPITRAIAEGWLVPPYAAVVPVPNLNPAEMAGLTEEEEGERLIELGIVEHTAKVLAMAAHHATRLPDREHSKLLTTQGRRWLVYCASVRQCQLTAERLEQDGWRARWASGETSDTDRARLLKALGDGHIDVICSPTIFLEGTDCPAVDGAVNARALASWVTFSQAIGRGLRIHDPAWKGPGINARDPRYQGKTECLLIDLSGASEVHDLRAAPVLIGGSKCPEAPNGVHSFARLDDGRGQCGLCEKTIACFEALGPHVWVDAAVRTCKHCGKPQCEGNADGRHLWTPLDDTSICAGCGAEIRLRTGELKKPRVDETVDAAWLSLPAVSPETWAVGAADFGYVFVRADRDAETGECFLVRKGGRKAYRIGGGAVPLSEVRAWPNDILRRVDKVTSKAAGWRRRDPTPKQLEKLLEVASRHEGARWLGPARRVLDARGPTAGDVANEITRIRARERAIATGICREET